MATEELGHYEWGSLLLRTERIATPSGVATVPPVDAIMRNRGSWENQLGFVALIALLHELAHFAQDLYTGIGHWDFLVRETYVREGLEHALNIPGDETAREERARQLDVDLEKRLIWLPESKVDLARRGRNLVFAALSGGSIPDGEPLLTDSLLEGEAAVTVFRFVSALEQGDLQKQIADENEALFDPPRMGAKYSASRTHLTSCLEAALPGLTATPEMAEFCDYLFLLLVDLASAQPPPVHEPSPSLRPELKFQTLVQVVAALSSESMTALIEDVFSFRFSAAESRLTRNIPWWTPVRDVYSAWLEYFRDNAEASMYPHIYDLRAKACEHRATSPDLCVVKVPRRLPMLPWLVITPMGLHFGGIFEDHALFWEIADEIFRFNAEWGAVDLLLRRKELVCPWGEARLLCAAQQPVCTEGIIDIGSLPRDTADILQWRFRAISPKAITSCGVRRSLQDVGWTFSDV
jgi:hypothetical protein